jgi:hypothetical protein
VRNHKPSATENMKSPNKELSPQPLIDVWQLNGINHERDSVYQRSLSSSSALLESSSVRKRRETRMNRDGHHDTGIDSQWELGQRSVKLKKKVSFSPAVITIHFPNHERSNETAKSIPCDLWYSASDFQRFRADSYEIAAKASGDVDYQHFFLNSVYSKAATVATSASCGLSETFPSVTYTPFTGLYANPRTRNFMSICIDNFSDLCMLSKYRGLERIIFRNLVQPSKLSYIESCIQHHKQIGETESLIGKSLEKNNSFRHHTISSQVVSQYLGQIDDIVVQEQVRTDFQHEHHLSFLTSQPVHLSFPALASLQILQRSSNDQKIISHRRRCFMEL